MIESLLAQANFRVRLVFAGQTNQTQFKLKLSTSISAP